jgi:CRISPR-associated protein Cmr3
MTTATHPWQGLRLDPLDVLFFHDGRPFDAANRVTAGLPNPQTLAGALRTALLARTGFPFHKFTAARRGQDVRAALEACGAPPWVVASRFRGPWLALARTGLPVEPLLPLPATLTLKDGGGWLRAEPRMACDLPGWEDGNAPGDAGRLLPLWRKGKPDTKAGGGFLTLTGLRSFLGKAVLADPEFFKPGDLYEFDNRTGIGIDMHTLTSAEGEFYGIRLLSLKPRIRSEPGEDGDPYHRAAVCLYSEVQPGEDAPDLKPYLAEPVPLGGEGRYVRVEAVAPCEWPRSDRDGRQSLWYLATPAFFDPARPPLSQGLTLRAAASGAGMAVSGWDVARNGPRPTRFAVPAGAVYFVDGIAPACGPFDLDEAEAAEGWGFALQGIW